MKLKTVLFINAISSGMTGILLAMMPQLFSEIFKVGTNIPFMGVGIFLILFSIFVFLSALGTPIKTSWVKIIITLDVIWVVASILSVEMFYSSISMWGLIIIIGVATWVGVMATLQKRTIKQL